MDRLLTAWDVLVGNVGVEGAQAEAALHEVCGQLGRGGKRHCDCGAAEQGLMVDKLMHADHICRAVAGAPLERIATVHELLSVLLFCRTANIALLFRLVLLN